MALSTIQIICTNDSKLTLFGDIVQLTKHEHSEIRRKAALVLKRFFDVNPNQEEIDDFYSAKFINILADKDPIVSSSAICFYYDAILVCKKKKILLGDFNRYCRSTKQKFPEKFKSLLLTFVTLQKQILDYNMFDTFTYNGIAVPWSQIKILRILSTLARNDKKNSEAAYFILEETMKKCIQVKSSASMCTLNFLF